MRANVCTIGSFASLTGPLLCLGAKYVKNYQKLPSSADPDYREWRRLLDEYPDAKNAPPGEKQRMQVLAEKFKDMPILRDADFRKWLNIVDEIPSVPIEIGAYLDQCSQEKRKCIKELAQRYSAILTHDELAAMFAHETGHMKNYDIFRQIGRSLLFLSSAVLAHTLAKELFRDPDMVYYAASGFVYGLDLKYSRQIEMQADAECRLPQYLKGMQEFQKKCFVKDLLESTNSDFQKEAAVMLQLEDVISTHPNFARRLDRLQQMGPQINYQSILSKTANLALVGLGMFAAALHTYFVVSELRSCLTIN